MSGDGRAPTGARVIGRASTAGVGLASVVSAVASLLVTVFATLSLSTAQNADFLTYWSMLFMVLGVLGGVQNEVTRAVRSASLGIGDAPGPTPGTGRGARVLPIALAIGGALAAVLVVSSPWWSGPVLGGPDGVAVAALAGAAVAFAGHAAVAGALSGRGAWNAFAGLVAAESTVRLVLAAGALAVGWALDGLHVAVAAATGTWLLVGIASRPARTALGARADVPPAALLRRTGQAMVAAASSAALVVGFATLLRLTTDPVVFLATAAPLLVAVQLTRAPLLMPLGAFQGVAITHFLAHRDRGLAALRPFVLGLLGLGALGAAAAAAVGPWLMATVLGEEYRVPGALLAALTFDGALLALVTLTGSAVLALDRHAVYAAGWVAATVTSVGVLLLPLALEPRTVLALAAGPLVGVVVHLRVAGRRRVGR